MKWWCRRTLPPGPRRRSTACWRSRPEPQNPDCKITGQKMNSHIDNIIETDGALILGAGIAGLFTALKLAPMPSIVLAGTRPGLSGSSAWAQGGIAAAMGEDDSWQSHAHDTMVAGAGLCDAKIVDLVAREAPARIEDLI